jgi:hypothetical protein
LRSRGDPPVIPEFFDHSRRREGVPGCHLHPAPGALALSWRNAGHDLPAVTPIPKKIRVRGQYDRVGGDFAHSHKTRIGQTHWNVSVLLHEVEHTHDFGFEVEGWNYCTAAEQCVQARGAVDTDKMKCFGEDSLARGPWRRMVRCVCESPGMVSVATAEKRDKETGVNEDACRHGESSAGNTSCGY